MSNSYLDKSHQRCGKYEHRIKEYIEKASSHVTITSIHPAIIEVRARSRACSGKQIGEVHVLPRHDLGYYFRWHWGETRAHNERLLEGWQIGRRS